MTNIIDLQCKIFFWKMRIYTVFIFVLPRFECRVILNCGNYTRLSQFLKNYSFLQLRYRMKHTKTLATLFAAILVATVFCGNYSFADFDVSKILENFNNMNGNGVGFIFTFKEDSQGDKLTSKTDTANVNIDSYTAPGSSGIDASGLSYFRSFCVEPRESVEGNLVGTLNYELKDTGKGEEWVTQTSRGDELTVGAAILYKEFAVGDRSADGLREAILTLMGMITDTDWLDNLHLRELLSKGSKAEWMAHYDPGRYEDTRGLMGDYCVFVMTVVSPDDSETPDRQDFLYIAKVDTNTDVPEPASILLWTIGGLGVAGSSWVKKRRMKKLIAA